MMSSTTDEDPYLSFQSDVQTLMDQTRTSFSSYLRIRSLAAATSPELASARSELTALVSELSSDVAELSAAVAAVENDPYRFGLDVADVAARRRFVDEVAGELDDMREELARESARPNAGAGGDVVIDVAGNGNGNAGAGGGGGGGGGGGAEDPVAEYERLQQQTMMHEQDQQLEGIGRTVGNLREQAEVMGTELREQETLLDGFAGDVERVEGKLKRGGKDLARFIKKNEDTASNWCIGILVLVLTVLLFLVIII